MGRYNFRPQQIHEKVTALFEAGRLDRKPTWYNVVGDIRPPDLLTRRRVVQHPKHSKGPQRKRPSKLFQPMEITYPEDELRHTFFKDHPWELARPRIVLEDNGLNHVRPHTTIRQNGQLLSGESVVQRQMHLMGNEGLTKTEAYDVARTEFYKERLREDVERRVAREEALHYGAFFGKNRLEIGMELEDQAFEDWKVWAGQEVDAAEQLRSGSAQPDASSTFPDDGSLEDAEELGVEEDADETVKP